MATCGIRCVDGCCATTQCHLCAVVSIAHLMHNDTLTRNIQNGHTHRAIDIDSLLLLTPITPTLIRYVKRWHSGIPACTVEVVGILLGLMIALHHTRKITPIAAARRGVVKHIINPHTPEDICLINLLDVALMHVALTSLGQMARIALSTLYALSIVATHTRLAIVDTTAQRCP